MSDSPRTIDFCIPYIATGTPFIEFFVDNLLATAAHPGRIRILASYHTDADRDVLLRSSIAGRLHRTVQARPYTAQETPFFPSANHASAINALTGISDADIVVMSDYDMAFLQRGWDTLFESWLYADALDLAGVPYANIWLSNREPALLKWLPWLDGALLGKYQELPNLSFLITRREVLQGAFGGRFTQFDRYLAAAGLPFRVINTLELANINGLPHGSLQWMDTGYEIPEIVHRHGLRHACFGLVAFGEQQDLESAELRSIPPMRQPEIYRSFRDNRPLLCHFRKGTGRIGSEEGMRQFAAFRDSVNAWLQKAPQPAG